MRWSRFSGWTLGLPGDDFAAGPAAVFRWVIAGSSRPARAGWFCPKLAGWRGVAASVGGVAGGDDPAVCRRPDDGCRDRLRRVAGGLSMWVLVAAVGPPVGQDPAASRRGSGAFRRQSAGCRLGSAGSSLRCSCCGYLLTDWAAFSLAWGMPGAPVRGALWRSGWACRRASLVLSGGAGPARSAALVRPRWRSRMQMYGCPLPARLRGSPRAGASLRWSPRLAFCFGLVRAGQRSSPAASSAMRESSRAAPAGSSWMVLRSRSFMLGR